jgi:hypothetical protein
MIPRLRLFLGILWRRIDDRDPARINWATAWDVARTIHG